METIALSIAARPDELSTLRSAIGSLSTLYAERPRRPTPRMLYAWSLAIHEAATNIVRHGYAGHDDGRIDLTIEPHGDHVTFWLADHGRPNDAWSRSAPRPAEEEGGYGLPIICALMDEARYERAADGRNVLCLVGRLPPPRR